MEKFGRAGDFCPNEECQDYGKLQSDLTDHIWTVKELLTILPLPRAINT